MIYLLEHLTNDYYWPYPGCRKWWLRVQPPYSAVLCELFQRVWLSSTFQIHRKMYCNHYQRILTSYESYSNHNSLFQLKCALIFSFLAIITLTPEGNFAWNSACGKGCVRLTKYKLTTTIENVHIFTNFHCKCKRLSTFPVHFIPLRIFLKSTLEVLTWFPENIRSLFFCCEMLDNAQKVSNILAIAGFESWPFCIYSDVK